MADIIGLDGKTVASQAKPVPKIFHFAFLTEDGNDIGFDYTGILFMSPGAVGVLDEHEVVKVFVPLGSGLAYVKEVQTS